MARWAAAAAAVWLLLALVAHARAEEEHVVTLDGDEAFNKAVKDSEFLVAGARCLTSNSLSYADLRDCQPCLRDAAESALDWAHVCMHA
jgi:hypothetical protein